MSIYGTLAAGWTIIAGMSLLFFKKKVRTGTFFIRFQFRQVPKVTNGFNFHYIHYKNHKSIINGHTGMPNMELISKNDFSDISQLIFHIKRSICRTNELGHRQELSMLFPNHPYFLLISIILHKW
jgi:hypothetical protein